MTSEKIERPSNYITHVSHLNKFRNRIDIHITPIKVDVKHINFNNQFIHNFFRFVQFDGFFIRTKLIDLLRNIFNNSSKFEEVHLCLAC